MSELLDDFRPNDVTATKCGSGGWKVEITTILIKFCTFISVMFNKFYCIYN